MERFCNIYIGLWCLYYLQGTLYDSGSILSRVLLLILLLISLCCYIYAINRYKLSPVLKTLALLVGIWTIYGGINILFGNGVKGVNSFEYLKAIYMSVLPIFAFYVFAKKGALTGKSLRIWAFIFFSVAIAFFYNSETQRLQRALSEGDMREEFTNNAAYVIVSLLPLIPLFHKKPLVQYVLLGLCMFFIILGVKRGAILTGFTAVVWFFYTSMFSGGKKNSKTKWRFVLTIVLILGAIYAVQYFLTQSDLFIDRFEMTLEGESSGRDMLFDSYLKYLLNDAKVVDLLVGAGADATLRLGRQYAHNDWLEIAINNGILVTFLFGVFICRLYFVSRQSRSDLVIHQVLGLFFIVFFLKTFFSMSYNDVSFFSSSVFAYALVTTEIKR